MFRAFIITALIAASWAQCMALQWNVEPVYPGSLGLGDCTLLISAGVTPRVVYGANSQIILATWNGYQWQNETVAACGPWGGWSSANLSASGAPVVVFIFDDGDSTTVKCALKPAGSWVTEDISSVGWLTDFVAVAVDSAGTVWVAFCDGQANPSIKVAKRVAPGSWSVTTISAVGDVTGPAIAMSSDNIPYVSFVDAATGTLKLAHLTLGGTWSVESVDGSPTARALWYTSLAFDPAGRPAIAYFGDASSGTLHLKYAVKTAGGWLKERVADLPTGSAQHCSLAFDSDGNPWIAYFDGGASSLACARKIDGAWTHEVVDPTNMAGYRPCIRIDASGNPAIAYVDSLAHGVSFASSILPRSLPQIKNLPDGVTVRCEGLVTTTAHDDTSTDLPDRHYVESPDRCMGIQLYYGGVTDEVLRGYQVTVTGVTGTVGGERAICDPAISGDTLLGELRPLGLTNQAVGGGDFAYVPGPPPSGQRGIASAAGLNNIGLLVRTAGRVAEVDPTVPPAWFKIDDGSGVRLKCLLPEGTPAPSGFVAVTGISSCEEDAHGDLTRLIRVRNAADITTF